MDSDNAFDLSDEDAYFPPADNDSLTQSKKTSRKRAADSDALLKSCKKTRTSETIEEHLLELFLAESSPARIVEDEFGYDANQDADPAITQHKRPRTSETIEEHLQELFIEPVAIEKHLHELFVALAETDSPRRRVEDEFGFDETEDVDLFAERAAPAVLQTAELLERILHGLPTRDLLLSQRVCRTWRKAIESSQLLQAALFYRTSDICKLNGALTWRPTPIVCTGCYDHGHYNSCLPCGKCTSYSLPYSCAYH